jgi:hypothetical protein
LGAFFSSFFLSFLALWKCICFFNGNLWIRLLKIF